MGLDVPGLPEHYKAVAVRVPVREELSEEETLLKESWSAYLLGE